MTTALTLADYGLLTAIVTVPLSAGLVVLEMIRRRLAELSTQYMHVSGKLEAFEDRLEEIERDKFDKRDAIRESLDVKDRIDTLSTSIARMEGKIDSTLGTAAAVDRLTGTVRTVAEKLQSNHG
jgi:hypothetical protein